MKNTNLLKTTASLIALQSGMFALSAAPALAQDDAVDNEDVIIVSTRKKDESLFEVPVAVTAFSALDIEEAGLKNLNDLSNFTPGFTYETFGTTTGRLDNTPRFRGVTTNSANPLRQTASVFVDGVYVANGVQGLDFNAVQRVELIKGPQSALYGRATFGGAVNFITRTPGDEVAINFSALAATRGLYEVSAGVEGPILGDWLKGRISGSFSDKQGHYRSTFDNGRVGNEQTWSVGGTLYAEPSDRFDAKLHLNYFENDDGVGAFGVVGQDLLNCGPTSFEADPSFPGVVPGQQGPLGGAEAFFCGTLPTPQPNIPTVLPAGIQSTLAGMETLNGDGTRRENDGFGLDRQSARSSLQWNYDLTDNVTFSSLTGYNYEEVNQLRLGEGNNLGAPAFFATNSRQFTDFSQEIRLAGALLDDALDWSIGGNYFDQTLRSSGGFGLNPSGFLFGANGTNRDEETVETLGVFGSLGYDITDRIHVTFEGRYQEDTVTDDSDSTDATPPLEATFTSFLPRVILEYTPVDGTLIYASYSEGNLPGGFNSDFIGLSPADQALVVAVQPFSSETTDEEDLKNYEIGVKHGFEGGSIAAAFYYIDRTNQISRDTVQIPDGMGGTQFINQFLNIGKSEAYGVEVEGVWRPIDNLTLDGSVAYIDSEFVTFASANNLRVFGDADASGNRSERFPRWSGSFSWQYEGDLNSDWGWYFRNDNSYQGKRFASEVNLANTDEGVVSNLRIGAKSDNLRIEAFVTNLFDDDSPLAAVRSTDLGSVVTRTNGARPFDFLIGLRDRRQFGVRISGNY